MSLKLYGLDQGYHGGVVVVATSRKEAWEMLTAKDPMGQYTDSSKADLVEKPITPGIVLSFVGTS